MRLRAVTGETRSACDRVVAPRSREHWVERRRMLVGLECRVPNKAIKPVSALVTESAESQFRANPSFGRTRLRLIADVTWIPRY